MFVIKYDKLSMIKLVQSIEKYPSLYNTKEHYLKEEQDIAWDEVAKEVGEKDSLCRDRWHSIKSCYMRHLKYTALNSKRKPYYLAEYLDFLIPFVSDRIKKFISIKQFELNNLPTYLKEALPPTPSYFVQSIDNEANHVVKAEVVDIEDVSDSGWLSVSSESQQQPSSSNSMLNKSKPNSTFSSSKKLKTHNSNDDVNFFRSLLPDVARMSNHQKLKFKQEALSIVEDILYASDEIDITE